MSRPPRDDDYWEQLAEEQQAERDGYRPNPRVDRYMADRAADRYERWLRGQ